MLWESRYSSISQVRHGRIASHGLEAAKVSGAGPKGGLRSGVSVADYAWRSAECTVKCRDQRDHSNDHDKQLMRAVATSWRPDGVEGASPHCPSRRSPPRPGAEEEEEDEEISRYIYMSIYM